MQTPLIEKYEFTINNIPITYDELVETVRQLSEEVVNTQIINGFDNIFEDQSLRDKLNALDTEDKLTVAKATLVPYVIGINLRNLEELINQDKTFIFGLATSVVTGINKDIMMYITPEEESALDKLTFTVNNIEVSKESFYLQLRKVLLQDFLAMNYDTLFHALTTEQDIPSATDYIRRRVIVLQIAEETVKQKIITYIQDTLTMNFFVYEYDKQLFKAGGSQLYIKARETDLRQTPREPVLILPRQFDRPLKGRQRYN